jgi:hypothetical protein
MWVATIHRPLNRIGIHHRAPGTGTHVMPFSVARVTRVAVIGIAFLLAFNAMLKAAPKGWPGPQGTTYASIGQLPDWSGTWAMPDQERGEFLNSPAAVAPYLAGYAERAKPPKANPAVCLPTGMPGIMAVPLGFEFLFTPGRVTILSEEGPTIRRVYTDGRSHMADPDLTYAGDSIGHWEGSTLVIDTTAIRPKSEYFRGIKTSGQAHVVERITRVDRDHMRVDTVVEDAGALSRPWHYSFVYIRSDTGFIESYYCDDNRDANGEPDLQPP